MHLKPVPTLLAIAVLAVGGFTARHFLSAGPAKQAPEPPPIPVTVAAARQTSLPVYLQGIGTVQALNAVEIHPQVGGVLTAVPVREGQDVAKGDVVAVIDPRPLQAALDRANAQRTQDQAQLENAKLDQQRYAALARNDFASRQQLDTQTSTVARLTGVVQADQASIEEAQINLGYSVLHSPIDGRVSLRRVDPGNLIQANATGPGILSIMQVHPITVVFTQPENTINRVREAMAKGTLTVLADGANAGPNSTATGQLLTPDNAVNSGTGTIQFKALFPNTDDRLTPGQFVDTRLQVGTASGVTVPHVAVQHGQDDLFVFAVKPDKTVDKRTITVAFDNGDQTIVSKGVQDGEQVVTQGQSRIGPGSHVSFGQQNDGKQGGSPPPDPQAPAAQSASR